MKISGMDLAFGGSWSDYEKDRHKRSGIRENTPHSVKCRTLKR